MLDIAIYKPGQHQQSRHASTAMVSLGNDDKWYVANSHENGSGDAHLRCTLSKEGVIVLVDCDHALRNDTRQILTRGDTLPIGEGLHLVIGQTHIEFRSTSISQPSTCRLEALSASEFRGLRDAEQGGPAPATLGRWLEALGSLHRHPASSLEFFADAASFVVNPVGLDGALVLQAGSEAGSDWRVAASCLPHPRFGVGFAKELVEHAAQQRQTLFHAAYGGGKAVVVSPWLDEQGNVAGVIYGYRAPHADNARRNIRYLEAQLVELLAKSVSTGMQRLAAETQAAQQREIYQRCFAPSVVSQVELNAELLEATEREVTVLFADLRNSSLLTKQLSATHTYQLLSDVMQALTDSIMRYEGVLIDYYGDGLAAMWNAPIDQPQHALQACRAAENMQTSLNEVNELWSARLDEPLKLGVGLHCDTALVGNIGSTARIKYGPRGAMVNLASRLEQFTKRCDCSVVTTKQVAERLGRQLLTYRVCKLSTASAEQPVDVFAIRQPTNDPHTVRLIAQYEQAVSHFEAGDLQAAGEVLGQLNDRTGLPIAFLRDQIAQENDRRIGRRADDDRRPSYLPAVELAK